MATTTHRIPGETYAGYTQLEAVTCPTCGVLHAAPEALLDEARARKPAKSVYCPNGHSWHYAGETDAERLDRERQRAARLAAQRDQAQASAAAQKRAATRARNERDKDRRRVAHGVCPCCKRTFKALGRHMASQHPDYAEPSA